MAKRQTETKIWATQRWYKKLHPYYKLAWKYLTDCCDHAGIWKIDYGQLVDDTGIEDFKLNEFIEACNSDFDKETGERIFRERIMVVGRGVLWLTGFVKFQYENKDFQVNPDVPVVKSALQILNGYGILREALEKGYIALSKPFGTLSKPYSLAAQASPDTIAEKNGANNPLCGEFAPENSPHDPLGGLVNPSEPLSNPSEGEEEGTVRTKYKEHNTKNNTLPLESKQEDSITKKSNPEQSKRAGESSDGGSDGFRPMTGTGPPGDVGGSPPSTPLPGAMLEMFVKAFPEYPRQDVKDYTACMQLGYQLVALHGWSWETANNGRMFEVLGKWKEIVAWIPSSSWFRTKSLSFLNDKFQDLIQAKNNGTGQQKNLRVVAPAGNGQDPTLIGSTGFGDL